MFRYLNTVKKTSFLVLALLLCLPVLSQAAATLNGQLNLNTAQVDELVLLPGIGAKKAEAIVAFRETKSFAKIEDVLEVKGIGPKMFENLKPYVKVEGASDLQVDGKAITNQ